MCEKGPACDRRICFFAHDRSELRRPGNIAPGTCRASGRTSRAIGTSGSITVECSQSAGADCTGMSPQQRHSPIAAQPGTLAATLALAAVSPLSTRSAALAAIMPAQGQHSDDPAAQLPGLLIHTQLPPVPDGAFAAAYAEAMDAFMQPLQPATIPPQPMLEVLDSGWSADSNSRGQEQCSSFGTWSSDSSAFGAVYSSKADSSDGGMPVTPGVGGMQRLGSLPLHASHSQAVSVSQSLLPSSLLGHHVPPGIYKASGDGSARRWSDTGTAVPSLGLAVYDALLLLQQNELQRQEVQQRQHEEQQERERQQCQHKLLRVQQCQELLQQYNCNVACCHQLQQRVASQQQQQRQQLELDLQQLGLL